MRAETEPAGRWTTPWLAVRFTGDDERQVTFLRWYAHVENHLELLVPGDDPMLGRVGSDDVVEVAPVRRRDQAREQHEFVPATLRLGDAAMADHVSAALDRKYGWQRRIYRPAAWLVRRLGGPHRGKADVALSVVVQGEAYGEG